MNGFKKFLCLLALVVLLPMPAQGATDRGQQLFNIFLKRLSPETARFQLVEPPREDGFISWAYLECKNANIRGMNVQSLKMDCFDAQVTPPAEWDNMEHPRVSKMLSCHAEGTFTEQDVNDFLRTRVFGHDKEWEKVQVRITDDRIHASAYYNADLKIFKIKVRLDLSCRIVGRGTALWLEDIVLRVNNQQISTLLVERALDKLQPFIDMKKYNLPLYLSKIEFTDGICRVRSRIRPKPISSEGVQWNWPEGTVERFDASTIDRDGDKDEAEQTTTTTESPAV